MTGRAKIQCILALVLAAIGGGRAGSKHELIITDKFTGMGVAMMQLRIDGQLQQLQLDSGSPYLFLQTKKSELWDSKERKIVEHPNPPLVPSDMTMARSTTLFPNGPVGYTPRNAKIVDKNSIGYTTYGTNSVPCTDMVFYLGFLKQHFNDFTFPKTGAFDEKRDWTELWTAFELNYCSVETGECSPKGEKKFALEELFCFEVRGKEWSPDDPPYFNAPYFGNLLSDSVSAGEKTFQVEFLDVAIQPSGGTGMYNSYVAGNGLVGVDLTSKFVKGMGAKTMTVALQQSMVLFDEEPEKDWVKGKMTVLKRPSKDASKALLAQFFQVTVFEMGTTDGALTVKSKDIKPTKEVPNPSNGFLDTGASTVNLPEAAINAIDEAYGGHACCVPPDAKLYFLFEPETESDGPVNATMPITVPCEDSPCKRCMLPFGRNSVWDPGFHFLAYQVAQFDYERQTAAIGEAVGTWEQDTSGSMEGCPAPSPPEPQSLILIGLVIGLILLCLICISVAICIACCCCKRMTKEAEEVSEELSEP